MSNVEHMNETCHTHSAISQIWMGHGTYMDETCRKCVLVLAHIYICFKTKRRMYKSMCVVLCGILDTHVNESYQTHERVMSRI